MKKTTYIFLFAITLSLFVSLAFVFKKDNVPSNDIEEVTQADGIMVARLSQGDTANFAAIRAEFKKRNQGYDLQYYHQVKQVPAANDYRLAFIQTGGGTAELSQQDTSKVSVGDIVYLDKNVAMETDSLLDVLVFTVPEPLPQEIPAFIRPDWDSNITDVPGGCATENNAYRRILLTWQGKVGHYLYHALNAHRVRIMDSFTHYHPENGGFDEFYLVQMVMPKAKLITSDQVDLITQPEKVQHEHTEGIIDETQLQVGDLVYLPRGVAHRGLGGVLAQVITVPGFVPGSEIGLDHHLRAINENLDLEGKDKLPYNELASRSAVIK
ncbi:MAG: hypothetical protein ACLFUB_02980 [Cyclobacteriaceae bacterium]